MKFLLFAISNGIFHILLLSTKAGNRNKAARNILAVSLGFSFITTTVLTIGLLIGFDGTALVMTRDEARKLRPASVYRVLSLADERSSDRFTIGIRVLTLYQQDYSLNNVWHISDPIRKIELKIRIYSNPLKINSDENLSLIKNIKIDSKIAKIYYDSGRRSLWNNREASYLLRLTYPIKSQSNLVLVCEGITKERYDLEELLSICRSANTKL